MHTRFEEKQKVIQNNFSNSDLYEYKIHLYIYNLNAIDLDLRKKHSSIHKRPVDENSILIED